MKFGFDFDNTLINYDKIFYDLKFYQSQKDVQMVLRIKAIIAYEDGRNPNKIHMYLDVSQKTIKRWIKSYLTAGVEGLKDDSRSGRPPKVDKEQLQEILTKQRLGLQKACGSYGFVNGLKEIIANTLNDENWRIARPPFKLLNKTEKDEIINAYYEE
mgnify:CR=1 FL=1